MGNIVELSGRKGEITNQEFKRAVYRRETFDNVVAGINTLLHREVFIAPDIQVIHPQREPQYGTVSHPIKGDHTRLAISAGFPNALRAHGGLTAETALRTAAEYVHAYHIISGAIRVARGRHMFGTQSHDFSGSQIPDIWDAEYNLEGASKLALPYRAAGSVALHLEDLDSITLSGVEPPFPGHIAGLLNPLDLLQFRALSSAIQG